MREPAEEEDVLVTQNRVDHAVYPRTLCPYLADHGRLELRRRVRRVEELPQLDLKRETRQFERDQTASVQLHQEPVVSRLNKLGYCGVRVTCCTHRFVHGDVTHVESSGDEPHISRDHEQRQRDWGETRGQHVVRQQRTRDQMQLRLLDLVLKFQVTPIPAARASARQCDGEGTNKKKCQC